MRNFTSIRPTGFNQLAVAGSAVALVLPTGKVPASNMVQIIVENNDVRYRDDGTDPTAAVGGLLKAGTVFTYDGDLTKIKFIQVSAAATLDNSFYQVA